MTFEEVHTEKQPVMQVHIEISTLAIISHKHTLITLFKNSFSLCENLKVFIRKKKEL